jgi:hypothetical protein
MTAPIPTRRRFRPTPAWLIFGLLVAQGLFAPLLCWAVEAKVDEAKPDQVQVIAEIKRLGGKVTRDKESPGEPAITVDLSESKVTDAGLANLKELPQLQSLNLRGTRVTDAGLVNLKGLTNLHELDLSETKVTDAGLANLKGLSTLRELDLTDTRVSDEGVMMLKQALPNCWIEHWHD